MLLKNAKSVIQNTNLSKIAEFKCREICAPQNREINVSRKFHEGNVASVDLTRILKKLELLSAVASSNSYASFVLSKLPACIHNSIYAR